MITKLSMDFDLYNHVLTGLKLKGFGGFYKIFVCSRTILQDLDKALTPLELIYRDVTFTDKIRVALTEKDMFAVQDVMCSIEYDARFAHSVEDKLEDFAAARVDKDRAYWAERKARKRLMLAEIRQYIAEADGKLYGKRAFAEEHGYSYPTVLELFQLVEEEMAAKAEE